MWDSPPGTEGGAQPYPYPHPLTQPGPNLFLKQLEWISSASKCQKLPALLSTVITAALLPEWAEPWTACLLGHREDATDATMATRRSKVQGDQEARGHSPTHLCKHPGLSTPPLPQA